MLKIDIYDTKGKKISKMTLPKSIFSVKVNPKLLTQAVRVYLSNQRQSPAKTKTRSEVAYSTAKLYKQKGTGKARHGSRGAPIFVKGGVAHGPRGDQNYKLKLGRKARQKSLKMALTDKLNDGEIIIMGGLEKIKGKTKQLAKIIEKLKSPAFGSGYSTRPIRPCSKPDPTAGKQKSKITIVLSKIEENIIRAGKNIPYLEFLQAKQLNTYQVLNGGLLVFTQESLKGLEEILLEKK